MNFRQDIHEYGDPTPSSNAEYLRALKRNNEAQKPPEPGSLAATVPATAPGPEAERRRQPRYKCSGSVEFRTEGCDVRTWATVTDISQGGCYVEMQATSPIDTPVNMILDVSGIRVRVKGVVRVCYPFLGMGIAFTEIAEPDRPQLDELLLRLSSGGLEPGVQPDAKETQPASGLLMVTDARDALSAVAKYFQTNRFLSREEFTQLIGKSQSSDPPARR